MNNIRVLRWSNLLLLLTGYQMHWFDKKTQTYRISLGWVINVLCLACTYVACFAEHFQPLPVLKVMQDASPFLYGLMRMQLFLGAKAFCYAIYASWRAVGVANDLTESLPALSSNETRRRWPLEELVAYFLLLSTNFTLFFFCLYIGYEMDFELPPLKEAMIGTALFMPHLILAGSLRFYCILTWITRSRLRQLKDQLDELLSQSPAKTELELVGGTALAMSSIAPPDTDGMQCLSEQLQQLGTRFGACFDSLQRSLLLLLGLNGNGLLFGIYANVYYHSTWHLLFTGRSHRVFLASNALIFACIACDYLCLLLVQSCLERQVGPPAGEYISSIYFSNFSLSLFLPLAPILPGQTELCAESEIPPIQASTQHTQGHALHSMEYVSLQIPFDLAF